ncbi:MAG: aminotransferase class V-fold PLP-dependent enzyme [Parvularculaceae bacterium]
MQRDAFNVPEGRYFLTHSIGCQPKGYEAALSAGFCEPWRTPDKEAWPAWLAAIERFRDGLAPLIGARADDICPQTNVSSALAKILFSLPERKGRRKIVLTEHDFPTVGFVLAQAQRFGYELCFLPGGPRLADPETWTAALDGRTQLVLATHVFSNTSVKAPVAEIARIAREREIFSILDIAQSAGGVAIGLDGWRPDFAVGTSLKYLCGGTGAAFLWADPETAALCKPIDVGWFSHEAPFEFDIRSFRYAEGATRYFGGTASVAPFAGAASAHAILQEAGIETIETYNQTLLGRLIDALPRESILSMTRPGARGCGLMVRPADGEGAVAALRASRVLFDTRLESLRFSVHFYNSEDDVDALAALLAPYF